MAANKNIKIMNFCAILSTFIDIFFVFANFAFKRGNQLTATFIFLIWHKVLFLLLSQMENNIDLSNIWKISLNRISKYYTFYGSTKLFPCIDYRWVSKAVKRKKKTKLFHVKRCLRNNLDGYTNIVDYTWIFRLLSSFQ